jgi:triacylglycerol lipase
MKIYSLALISFFAVLLTGCASSGSGLKTTDNYCPKSYSSATALWLGGIANLAYEEDRNAVKSKLETQGLTLDEYDFRNKKYSVEGFIAYDKDKAVLSFAGTDDAKDLKNNAETWSEPVDDQSCGKQLRFHSGFHKAAMEVINHNNGALISHLAELQSQGKKIYITGHSLGGALATITAYYAKTATKPVDIAGVYTFGQPFTGDDDFQNCYDEKLKGRTFRFVSDKDIIPKTRLDSSYRHVGLFLFFNEKGVLQSSKPADYAGDFISFAKSSLLDAHSMSSYHSLLEKNKEVNPFSCN